MGVGIFGISEVFVVHRISGWEGAQIGGHVEVNPASACTSTDVGSISYVSEIFL